MWKSDKLKNGFTPLKDFVNHKTRRIERKTRPESYRSRVKKKERERKEMMAGESYDEMRDLSLRCHLPRPVHQPGSTSRDVMIRH